MKALLALALVATAAPVLAAPSRSEIRQADIAVATQRRALMLARQSHDPVTVAAARAKLKAAQAVAWGRRHPAPVPAKVAVR